MKRRIVLPLLSLGLVLGLFMVLNLVGYAAGPTGAIFTTTPDGGIVNENVRYDSKLEVYLDGGAPPNAPQTAAGLDDGNYVYQVTDPSGNLLLSSDASKCRVVRVANGVIVERLDLTLNRDGSVASTSSHTTNDACHSDDNAPHPTNPGVTGASGHHDSNVDVDHGDNGAVVVQMMPYGTTPNPGGVYKVWMTSLDVYLGGNKKTAGKLNNEPSQLNPRKQKPHSCPDFCAAADPGFSPSRSEVKTDNFKVREFFPPVITVRKFQDIDGDGVLDAGEPEIGVGDNCVDANGILVDCGTGGGWPYAFRNP